MKKNIAIFTVLIITHLMSCNNAEKKTNPLQAQADSLYKEVLHGHDIAMPQSMKITDLQKKTATLIDSINKLPAKAQQAAASYKMELENLNKDLGDAYDAMDKWMVEFAPDSFATDLEKRVKYLSEEKMKVENVKEAVLGSIQKAKTILKQ